MLRFITPCLILIIGTHCEANNANSGYVYSQEAGVWLRLHLETATWYEAGMRCTLEGGILASPTTSAIAQKMASMMAEQDEQLVHSVFTGINSILVKGNYTSLDGVPLSAIPVPLWDSYEDCVVLTRAGKLADVNCQSELPYFCRKDNAQKCGIQAKGYVWEPRTDSYYKFHRIARTWDAANSVCQAEGGHLVIINSNTESTVLKQIFAKNPENTITGTEFVIEKNYAHVGFKRNGDKFVTINGKSLREAGFEKWSPGEPNNPDVEKCGSIYKNGLLNDIDCTKKFAFICEFTV